MESLRLAAEDLRSVCSASNANALRLSALRLQATRPQPQAFTIAHSLDASAEVKSLPTLVLCALRSRPLFTELRREMGSWQKQCWRRFTRCFTPPAALNQLKTPPRTHRCFDAQQYARSCVHRCSRRRRVYTQKACLSRFHERIPFREPQVVQSAGRPAASTAGSFGLLAG